MDFMTEGMNSSMQAGMSMMSPASTIQIWEEMIDTSILNDQYDIIAGKWPQAYNEVVLIVDRNNELSDTILYSLGMKDQDELPEMMQAMLQGKPLETESPIFEYEDILNMSFKLVLPVDFYKYDEKTNTYEDMRENETYISYLVDKGETIKIVGIIRPGEDTTSTAMTGAIGYTSMLTEHVINAINNSEIVKKQIASPDTDVIENLPFETKDTVPPSNEEKASAIKEYISSCGKPAKFELLPYHAMGEHKYAALGRNVQTFSAPTSEKMENLKTMIKEKNYEKEF
jgi:putative ABC transport system permease protein